VARFLRALYAYPSPSEILGSGMACPTYSESLAGTDSLRVDGWPINFAGRSRAEATGSGDPGEKTAERATRHGGSFCDEVAKLGQCRLDQNAMVMHTAPEWSVKVVSNG
jgi:hypothetical protein